MNISNLINEIDGQIAKLQSARAAIISINTDIVLTKKRGRPVGSTKAVKPVASPAKRVMTPEGRAAIAAAQAKRWAAKHKADKKAAKVVTPTESVTPEKPMTAKKVAKPVAVKKASKPVTPVAQSK